MGDESLSPCIECREEIQTGARICHHCGSRQQARRLAFVATGLRWLGGTTAVVSLVLATFQMSGVVQGWAEERDAVRQRVRAAGLQIEAGDYANAWSTLEETLDIDPGSREARQALIQLAMERLREEAWWDWASSGDEFVELLLPTLYLGASSDEPRIAADAHAHLAWARFFVTHWAKHRDQIELHFSRALEKDPGNVFANSMRAYRLMTRVGEADAKARIEQAKAHIERARRSGYLAEYVDEREWWAFLEPQDMVVRLEAIKLAQKHRSSGTEVPEQFKPAVIRTLVDPLCETQEESGAEDARLLLASVPIDELSALFDWLHGEVPLADYPPPSKVARARLFEAAGDLDAARSLYEAAQGEVSYGDWAYRGLQEGLERTSRPGS